jgi:hypothetical protein
LLAALADFAIPYEDRPWEREAYLLSPARPEESGGGIVQLQRR